MPSTLSGNLTSSMHDRLCFKVPVSISKHDTSGNPYQGYCHRCSKNCPFRSKDAISRNEVFRIMDLPTEIRLQIFAEICKPTRTGVSYGGASEINWIPSDRDIPAEIIRQGVSTYYGRRRLVFEIPEFVRPRKYISENPYLPSLLGKSVREPIHWPSTLRMYDTENHFSLELEPFFLRDHMRPPRNDHGPGLLSRRDLESCPFHLFSGITIMVPPYDGEKGYNINWCRLRFVGLLLERIEVCRQAWKRQSLQRGVDIRNSPTPVKIVFADSEKWSWCDKQGEPKRKLADLAKLDGDNTPPSDLVVMLRALAPIRNAGTVTVVTPSGFPKSELDRKFSVSWFMEKQTHDEPIGQEPWPVEPELQDWLDTFETFASRDLRDKKLLHLFPSCPSEGWHNHRPLKYKVFRRLPYLGPAHINGRMIWGEDLWQKHPWGPDRIERLRE